MAATKTPPVPIKVFKHFAIVTVVITALTALFADGENREVVEKQIAAQIEEQERREARNAEPTLARAPSQPSVHEGFSDSVAMGFGEPMVRQRGSENKTGYIPGSKTPKGREAIPGYSQDYLDGLSEEEYEALLSGLREAGMLDPKTREQQIAALQRASIARSGTATPAE